MATGYYSKISNTVVSGNELIASLTGKNVRDLEFASSVNNADPVAVTSADVTLSVSQLIQAAVDRLLVDPSGITAASTSLLLGPDVVTQAQAYVKLFNLNSTNQTRVLTFTANAATASGKVLGLHNSTNTTGTYVKVSSASILAGNGLYAQARSTGVISGVDRQVLVQGTTLTSGSEVVTFTVLNAVNGVSCLS